MSKTIVCYAHNRAKHELRQLGCDVVYADKKGETDERDEMIARGLRKGDIVRVLYMRDLGLTPPARKNIIAAIEAQGVTIEEIRPEKQKARMGRPPKFDPPPDREAEIREIWLNGGQSERKRLDLVEALAGKRPARGVMHARYGNPSNPKPPQEDE